jgi:hypothetical protein
MCKDRVVTGKQLRDRIIGVDVELKSKQPGHLYHYCTRCDEKMMIVPRLPWMGRKGSLDKKGRIKDDSHVWLRHYYPNANINNAEKIYER